VVFDGRCRVCSGLARWLRARPGMREVRIIPNQAPGVAEEFGYALFSRHRGRVAFLAGPPEWRDVPASGADGDSISPPEPPPGS
jgi:hypothetical protein